MLKPHALDELMSLTQDAILEMGAAVTYQPVWQPVLSRPRDDASGHKDCRRALSRQEPHKSCKPVDQHDHIQKSRPADAHFYVVSYNNLPRSFGD